MASTSVAFRCPKCSIVYSSKYCLSRHNKTCHTEGVEPKDLKTLICSACSEKFRTHFELAEHFAEKHALKPPITLAFGSEEELKTWIKHEESEGRFEFARSRGIKRRKECTVEYFRCFRTGKFRSKSKGYRAPKALMTNKIDKVCPAYAKVIRMSTGEIRVEACLSHFGHDNLIRRLSLPEQARQEVAQHLLEDREVDWIVRNERRKIDKGNGDMAIIRANLLTSTDVHNIKNQYGACRDFEMSTAAESVICEFCQEKLENRFRLYRHIRRNHPESAVSRSSTRNCGECGKLLPSIRALIDHLNLVHAKNLVIDMLHFDSDDDFSAWLLHQERNSNFRFVRVRTVTMKDVKTRYFQCHRSGHFSSTSKGVRALKSQGSNKVGFTCSAYVVAKESASGAINVEACLEHYGHDQLPKRQQLAKDVAHQRCDGVPIYQIVMEELENVEIDDDGQLMLNRENVFTATDVRNDIRHAGLLNGQLHEDELASAEMHAVQSERDGRQLNYHIPPVKRVGKGCSLSSRKKTTVFPCKLHCRAISTETYKEKMNEFCQRLLSAQPADSRTAVLLLQKMDEIDLLLKADVTEPVLPKPVHTTSRKADLQRRSFKSGLLKQKLSGSSNNEMTRKTVKRLRETAYI